MANSFTELAFTDSVRKMQEDYGTRALYEKFEAQAPTRNTLTWKEKGFVARRDGFYLASVGENGSPYLQYRGDRPVSSRSWRTTYWHSPTFAETANSSARATLTPPERPCCF